MSDQSPDIDPAMPAARPARLRREARARRRRQAALALLVLAVLVVGAVVIVNNKDDDKKGTTRASSNSTNDGASSSTTAASSTTTATSGNSTTVSPNTAPPKTVPLALPEADRKAPPDPPEGLYRSGKLRLVGSVPSAAVAIRYRNRFQKILGRDNVTVAMQRDPRVPASPMRVIVEEEFRFGTGSFVVDPKFAGLLNLGVVALKNLPEARLVVTGYTDNVGSAQVNQSLSEQRAQVVVDWMVKGGIPANRVLALGRGPSEPIATNSTPEGREKNRRIEATLEGVRP